MHALPTSLQLVAQTTHRDTYVLDAISGHILRAWAKDGRVLRVQVRRGPRKDVAILEPQDGASTLRLDLVAVT